MTEENKETPNDKFDAEGNLKPPTVPLFQIPNAVLNSMSKEASPDLTKFANPVEWIMAQRKFAEAQVQGPQGSPEAPTMPPQIVATTTVPAQVVPQKKNSNVPKVAWGGNDLNEEALTMLFYMVVKEVSKDKKIKKYLKDLNVEIYDINDELLWP